MKRLLAPTLAIAALASLHAQSPGERAVDWNRLRPEILERYRDLVKIDTTAGRETLAVDYLKKVLEGEGISDQDLRARSQTREPGGAAQGQRKQTPAADPRAHRRRRRAAREMARGSVRRRDEGRLHLGPRQQGRQAGAGGESRHDADAEAPERAARPGRHLPRRVRRRGRHHRRRDQLHGARALPGDRRRVRDDRRRRRHHRGRRASRRSTSAPRKSCRRACASSRRARPATAPRRASTTR